MFGSEHINKRSFLKMGWSKWINLFCIIALGSVMGYKLFTHQHISTPHFIISSALILWNIIGLFRKESSYQTRQTKEIR
ncbi:hypothetical protein CD007_03005 [Bacillus subtilis]|nr:hypothetical protein CD007_03005 [Bacillus subtilis]EHA29081.1 hypothetical protein BSSC8_37900 [Bacillus subtilis subsp. subtilis str. SC-8]QCY76961.1 hypothetical protein CAH07_18235 [Bacillus subtilis]